MISRLSVHRLLFARHFRGHKADQRDKEATNNAKMALQVWKSSQQGGGFVLCVVTIPLCLAATALRFWASARTSRKVGVEDWLALVALVFFEAYTSMFLYRKSGTFTGPEPAHYS